MGKLTRSIKYPVRRHQNGFRFDRQTLIEDVTNLKIPGQLIELTKMTMEMSKANLKNQQN